jgi:hypothetical protein
VERLLHARLVSVAGPGPDDRRATGDPRPFGVADLLAPLGVDEFLDTRIGRGPAVIEGRRSKFDGLFSWDRLNRLLADHRLAPPRLRLERAGASADQLNVMVRVPRPMPPPLERVDPALLYEALRNGATLIVNGVEEVAEELTWLADDVAAIFSGRPQFNLYASFGHAPGFGLHWDGRDVWTLQVRGAKRWQVRRPSVVAPLYGAPQDRSTAPRDVEWEGVLHEGDVLYVPRGWWHEAVSIDEPSMHLTVGWDPVTGVDYVAWLLERLREDVRFRIELPRFGDKAELPSYERAIAAAIAEHVAASPPSRFLDARRTSVNRDRPHFALPDAVATRPASSLPLGTVLRRSAPVLEHRLDGDHLVVEANGATEALPPWAKAAVVQLANRPWASVGDLCAACRVDRAEVSAVVRQLVASGLVYVVRRDATDPWT